MAGKMSTEIIDITQAVKRKNRKIKTIPKLRTARKTGHLYSDLKNTFSKTMYL